MQLSQVPVQIVKAWATAGSKTNPIPVPSQISITPGAASWTDGFPPLCDTNASAGGMPPTMPDMNGGLYQMSAIDLWMCAGGGFPYNSAFQTAIGGYPKGARVLMSSGNGYWVSTTDNNVTDPNTGGAGWASADENAITALTGDVTAIGPGSAAATVKWVSPGTIGSTTPNTGAFTTLTATTPGSSDNSNHAATTAWCFLGFAVSLAANGYIKLPTWMGGLILQWGNANAATSSQVITFPLNPFPNNVWCVLCQPINFGPNAGRATPYLDAVSTSGFTQTSAGSTNSIYWLAIGN